MLLHIILADSISALSARGLQQCIGYGSGVKGPGFVQAAYSTWACTMPPQYTKRCEQKPLLPGL